jgi:hypothetical protein
MWRVRPLQRSRGHGRLNVGFLHFRPADASRVRRAFHSRPFDDFDLAPAIRILTVKSLALPHDWEHVAPPRWFFTVLVYLEVLSFHSLKPGYVTPKALLMLERNVRRIREPYSFKMELLALRGPLGLTIRARRASPSASNLNLKLLAKIGSPSHRAPPAPSPLNSPSEPFNVAVL